MTSVSPVSPIISPIMSPAMSPAISPVMPIETPEQAPDITINQTNNAVISGNIGSLALANVADIRGDYNNITVNQTNNVFMMASRAYDSSNNLLDGVETWLKELLASLVTGGQTPDAPQPELNAPANVTA